MSNRRAFQKKLSKLLSDLTQCHPEIVAIAEAIEQEQPFIELILNPSKSIDYKGDEGTLKSQADDAFKLMSKIRGKRKEVEHIVNSFGDLFAQEYQQGNVEEAAEEAPRSKRSRASEANDLAPAKKKPALTPAEDNDESLNSSSLSKATKALLRQLIVKISKLEYADIFMYPVDSSVYPEYYEVITKPIDITTIKSKVNTYSSIEEALSDIRQIWENCRLFNADGSDIVGWANALDESTEAIIEELFGSEYKKAPKKKATKIKTEKVESHPRDQPSSKAKSKGPSNDEASSSQSVKKEKTPAKGKSSKPVTLGRKTLNKIISELKNHECGFPFSSPVSDDDAPGYSDVIETPMDLSTVDKNIKAGLYDESLLLFVNDVNLIWKNCVSYNDPASSIADWARLLAAEFSSKILDALASQTSESVSDIEKSLESTKKSLEIPPEEEDEVEAAESDVELNQAEDEGGESLALTTSTSQPKKRRIAINKAADSLKFKKSDLSPMGKAMWTLLDELKQEPISEPFLFPIDAAAVPGYLDVISTPMDLFTVRSNILAYLSESNPPESFFRDLNLIFDNCKKFNSDGSELYIAAEELQSITEEKFNNYFKRDEDGIYKLVENALKKKKLKLKKPNDESEGLQGFDKISPDDDFESSSGLKSTAEIDKLLSVLRSDNGPKVVSVKNASVAKSRDLLAVTTFPWILSPNLFELQSIGAINNGYGFHDASLVYPVGYRCTRMLRVDVVPIDRSTTPLLSSKCYTYIAVTSCVNSAASGQGPRFVLTVDGGTIVTESQSPRDAWAQLFEQKSISNMLRIRSDRIRHCRYLLNRLSIDDRAKHFIDENNSDSLLPTYNCPLWFRKIHNRLLTGFYDHEFDFAWDVRYIFRYALSKLNPESELTVITKQLSDMFEHFFNKWVINFQHRSVYDLAKGAWNDWESLKLYDGVDDQMEVDDDICPSCHKVLDEKDRSATISYSENAMDMKEGEIQVEAPLVDSNVQYCKRCRAVHSEPPVPTFDEAKSSVQQRHNISYLREEANLSCFIPNPELGNGWCQALRQRRGGLKGVFLSPMGFHLKDKSGEDMEKVKAFEEELDKRFVSELYNSNSENKTRRKFDIPKLVSSTISHWSYQGWTVEVEPSSDDIESEAKRMTVGDLMSHVPPTGYRYALYVPSTDETVIKALTHNRSRESILMSNPPSLNSSLGAEWSELTLSQLPPVGFFGLDIPDVLIRIEGLPAIELCVHHNSLSADLHRQVYIENLLRDREISSKQEEQEKAVIEIIQRERWHWHKQRLVPEFPSTLAAISNDSNQDRLQKMGFSALFGYSLSSAHGEILLCVWDVLDIISSMAGDWTFSLKEVMTCLDTPVNSAYPCLGQTIFDEILCLFSGILLQDMFSSVQDNDIWQTILTTLPLNILTWPALFRSVIHASRSLDWSSVESTELLLSPEFDSWQSVAIEVLFLLKHHPLLTVIRSISSHQSGTGIDIFPLSWKELDTSSDLYLSYVDGAKKVLDDINSLQARIFDESSLTIEIFSNSLVCALESDIPLIKALSEALKKWVIGLFRRWGISYSSDSMDTDSISEQEILPTDVLNDIAPFLVLNDINDGLYLKPHHFGVLDKRPESIFKSGLTKLANYETTLYKIRSSDPNSWLVVDKVAILSSGMELVCNSLLVQQNLKEKKTTIINSLSSIDDVPVVYAPRNNDTVEYKPVTLESVTLSENEYQSYSCCFTGTTLNQLYASMGPKSSKPVIVPVNYLDPPVRVLSQTSSTVSPPEVHLKVYVKGGETPKSHLYRGTHHVTMENFITRIISAREVAANDLNKHDSQIIESLASLTQSPFTIMTNAITNTNKIIDMISLRSQPLGFDRFGCQYWLLTAQDSMTIDILGYYTVRGLSESSSAAPGVPIQAPSAMPSSIDPAVLVRTQSGWWGRHSGYKLPLLVSQFANDIECERVLRDNMIARLVQARVKLYSNTLRSKMQQREWLTYRLKLESSLRDTRYHNVSASMTPSQISDLTKHIELVFARFLEIRQLVHFSMLLKKDYDLEPPVQPRVYRETYLKRQKRIKETNGDDTWELHPSKGWLRFHCLAHVRELAACTTATRLHADPTLLPQLRDTMSKSPFKLKWLQRTTKKWETKGRPSPPEPTSESSVGVITSKDSEPSKVIESSAEAKPTVVSNVVNDPFQDDDTTPLASGNNAHNKPVEQIHPVSGAVLRIHPSGKAAASFMGVSAAGISLCCSGKTQESFGFRWRFYDGPPVDWEAIKDKQTSKEEITAIAESRKKGEISQPATVLEAVAPKPALVIPPVRPSLLPTSGASMIQRPTVITSNITGTGSFPMSAGQAPGPLRAAPNFTASTVLVSPRMIKLKTELLNILFALPEKALKWPDPPGDPDSEIKSAESGAAVGDADADGDEAGADATGDKPESAEERAARKKKRREKRRLAMERIVTRIQTSSTPKELFDCVVSIEQAIPTTWTLDYETLQSQQAESPILTVAAVALRIYTFDRSMRYEDIPGVDTAALKIAYRPRTQFAPKCMVGPGCRQCLNHATKCTAYTEFNTSRCPEISDFVPAAPLSQQTVSSLPRSIAPTISYPNQPYGMNRNPMGQQIMGQYNRNALPAMNARNKGQDDDEDEFDEMDFASRKRNKDFIHIEFVQPYVPPLSKITNIDWI